MRVLEILPEPPLLAGVALLPELLGVPLHRELLRDLARRQAQAHKFERFGLPRGQHNRIRFGHAHTVQ